MTDQSHQDLKAEVERLSWRQLTLRDAQGEIVLEMTSGPHGSRWTAADGADPLRVSKVEIT